MNAQSEWIRLAGLACVQAAYDAPEEHEDDTVEDLQAGIKEAVAKLLDASWVALPGSSVRRTEVGDWEVRRDDGGVEVGLTIFEASRLAAQVSRTVVT